MTAKIRDIAFIVMALSIAALCLVLIVAIFALYPSVSDVLSNLSDATATLNRTLNDVEEAAEAFVNLADFVLEEANQ